MATKVKKGKCRACGKPIESTDPAVEICHGHHLGIEDGRPTFERDVDREAYGHMHEGCFLYLMGDPSAIVSGTT